MMKKMFLVFSHRLTSKQVKDAQESFDTKEFIYLPKELQDIWGNISPDIDSLIKLLEDIKVFIKKNANKGDIVLIQGDFGAVYEMVSFCKKLELLTVYATTKRISSEYKNENGQSVKRSIFEHRRFREYGK